MTPSRRDDYRDFVLDQLTALAGIRARPMFGGTGLYRDDEFFAIVYGGRLYFKTDEASRAAYRDRGMKPFRPRATQRLSSYYEVPVEIAEDAAALVIWARAALAAATGAPAARRRRG